MKRQSRRWLLNADDFIKGLITSVLGGVATTIQQSVTNWDDLSKIDTNTIGTVALMSGIGYLTKNWLTNSKGDIATNK